jgi:hypothetical protein
MIYKELIDTVIDHFSKEERYLKEIIASKEHFFNKTGVVFEEESFYESRMAAFVEWFILDRPMFYIGLTPVRYYYELFESRLDSEHKQAMNSLMRSLHSLFLFVGKDRDSVRVKDLFDGKRYQIFEQRKYVGINPGSIFEGRIIQKTEQWFFSDAYCIHPFDASKLIIKEIRRRNLTDRDLFLEFIMQLTALRLKCDRYKKVDVATIYNFNLDSRRVNSSNRQAFSDKVL